MSVVIDFCGAFLYLGSAMRTDWNEMRSKKKRKPCAERERAREKPHNQDVECVEENCKLV